MAALEMKKSLDLSSLNPVTKAFMAGSFSGTCSTILLQPLDLVKTKMQKSPGSSLIHISKEIVEKERVFGLWRGLKPSLARTVPGVGLYFACLHGIKTTFKVEKSSVGSAVTGASARCIAGMIMMPFTILKVRWEAGLIGKEKNLMKNLFNIGKTEGLSGLLKGALPTMVRDAPYSGLYLLFYDNLKNIIMPMNEDLKLSPSVLHLGCGVGAGCMASVVTQPADVVKTKMQLGGGGTSIRKASISIFKTQGFGGFMVGLGPRMARRSVMAALAWTVYEKAMVNMGIKIRK